MKILTVNYTDGELSPDQIENLRHLAGFAPHWFWWGPMGTVGWARKVPYSPASRAHGKVNAPATAGTLDQALGAMRRNGGGGIGLSVNTAQAGFVGIDLDNVVKDGELCGLGREAVEHFKDTYVEVSPSGTGLRIFAKGAIPNETPAGSTAVGQGFNGEAIKFEVYAAGGKGRFLRTTGALVNNTEGSVAPCQSGIDWVAGVMRAAKANNPDKGRGGNASPDNGCDKVLSLDAMFERLAELRPELSPNAVIEGMQTDADSKPRSKLAEAMRGNRKPWNDDKSVVDLFMCCEAVRRGAGSADDVVEVWGASALSDRDKFTRKDYQLRTVGGAARSVLTQLEKRVDSTAPVKISPELLQALEESGDKLVFGKSGAAASDVGNLVVLLRNHPDLLGVVGFNRMSQKAVRLKPWTVFDRGGSTAVGAVEDDDLTRVSMWLSRQYGVKLKRDEVMQGLDAAARDATFDPLADKLRELKWDGVPRVAAWLTRYAKVDDRGVEAYVSAAGQCFLVGAVARALSPGCKHDTVLVLEGAGGGGKSTLFRLVADAIAPDLFTDSVHDVSDTSALVENAGGCWIVEIAELAGIRRAADVEALKAAIPRTHDKFRRPYDRLEKELPRRFVFAATTNRSEYLNDPSGALLRRFWPVRTMATETNQIDRAELARVAPQLWAEAVVLYNAGAKWFIADSDGAAYRQWVTGREARREDGAFHDEAVAELIRWADDYVVAPKGRPLKDIASKVGDIRTAEGDTRSRMALAATLSALGLESRKTSAGTNVWCFGKAALSDFLLRGEVLRREQSALLIA